MFITIIMTHQRKTSGSLVLLIEKIIEISEKVIEISEKIKDQIRNLSWRREKPIRGTTAWRTALQGVAHKGSKALRDRRVMENYNARVTVCKQGNLLGRQPSCCLAFSRSPKNLFIPGNQNLVAYSIQNLLETGDFAQSVNCTWQISIKIFWDWNTKLG